MEIVTLGSSSPRRLELLSRFNFNIEVIPPDNEEIVDINLSHKENAEKISLEKLYNIKRRFPFKETIITADTFISFNNEILGKPNNITDAKEMLKLLSGKKHKVITGVSIYSRKKNLILSETEITDVEFRELTDNDIEFYLSTDEWIDAAGAYKIQGIGEMLIHKIIGSYTNVMGLPIKLIYGMFVSLNFINPVT